MNIPFFVELNDVAASNRAQGYPGSRRIRGLSSDKDEHSRVAPVAELCHGRSLFVPRGLGMPEDRVPLRHPCLSVERILTSILSAWAVAARRIPAIEKDLLQSGADLLKGSKLFGMRKPTEVTARKVDDYPPVAAKIIQLK